MTKLTRQILILVIFSGLLLGFYVIVIYGPKATRYTSPSFSEPSAPLTSSSSNSSSSAIDYSRAPANNHQDYQSTFLDKDLHTMSVTANNLKFTVSHINILDTTNVESLFSPAEKAFVKADVSLPYEFYRVTLDVTITN